MEEEIKTYNELVESAIDEAIGLCGGDEVCEGETMGDEIVGEREAEDETDVDSYVRDQS